MTKVTDRISDSAMVEFAKKQYESKQKSKVPTQLVHLTSKGLVYPETHPLRKGYVNMRYMTAYDEDIITNELYITEGIVFDVLLAELITDDIDISDISVMDKDSLIINARILGYGADYPILATDPKTGNTLTRTLDLSTIVSTEFKLIPDKLGEFEYKVNDEIKFKFRFKNNRDDQDIDPKRKISSFLFSVITEVNGDRTAIAIENFIKYTFSPKDSRTFRTYYSDNSPGMITDIELEGEDGDTFKTRFQLGPDLFWI
jgi:hypothetical protein